MKKGNKVFIGVVALVLFICWVVAIAFVSLYGENRKVDEAAAGFFEDLKNKNYQDICAGLSENSPNPVFSDLLQCRDSLFLFELSLLKQYDLLDRDNYAVEMKKSHFWVPFLKEYRHRVGVSIALHEQKKAAHSRGVSTKTISEFAGKLFGEAPKSSAAFVNNLLAVRRVRGVWRVVDINLNDSVIAGTYAAMKGRLKLDKYIRPTKTGFIIERVDVNIKEMKPEERRVLKYNLQKIESMIGKKEALP